MGFIKDAKVVTSGDTLKPLQGAKVILPNQESTTKPVESNSFFDTAYQYFPGVAIGDFIYSKFTSPTIEDEQKANTIVMDKSSTKSGGLTEDEYNNKLFNSLSRGISFQTGAEKTVSDYQALESLKKIGVQPISTVNEQGQTVTKFKSTDLQFTDEQKNEINSEKESLIAAYDKQIQELNESISPIRWGDYGATAAITRLSSLFGDRTSDLFKSEAQVDVENQLRKQIKQLEEDKQIIANTITDKLGNTKSEVLKTNPETRVKSTQPLEGMDFNNIESIQYNFTSANSDLEKSNALLKLASNPITPIDSAIKSSSILEYTERGLEMMYASNPNELALKKQTLLQGVFKPNQRPTVEQQEAMFVNAKSEQKELVSTSKNLSDEKQSIDANISKYLEYGKKGNKLTPEQNEELKRLSALSSNLQTNISLQEDRIKTLQSFINNNSETYKGFLEEQEKYDRITELVPNTTAFIQGVKEVVSLPYKTAKLEYTLLAGEERNTLSNLKDSPEFRYKQDEQLKTLKEIEGISLVDEEGNFKFDYHLPGLIYNTTKTAGESFVLGSFMIGTRALVFAPIEKKVAQWATAGTLESLGAGNVYSGTASYLAKQTAKTLLMGTGTEAAFASPLYLAESLVGSVTPSVMFYGDEMIQNQLKQGLTMNQSKVVGVLLSGVEGLSERFFPNEMNFVKSLIAKGEITSLKELAENTVYKKAVQETYKQMTGKTLSEKAFKILTSSGQFIKGAVPVGLEETVEEIAGLAMTDVFINPIAKSFNPNYEGEELTARAITNTAIATMATMLPMMGQAGISKISQYNQAQKSAQFTVGQNSAPYYNMTLSLFKEGAISEEEFQRRSQLINKHKENYKQAISQAITKPFVNSYTEDQFKNYTFSIFDKISSIDNLKKSVIDNPEDEKVFQIYEQENLNLQTLLEKGLFKTEEERIQNTQNSLDFYITPQTVNSYSKEEAISTVKKLQEYFSKEKDSSTKATYENKINLLSKRIQEADIQEVESQKTPEQKAEENNQKGQITIQRPSLPSLNIEFNTPYYLSTIDDVSVEGAKISKRPLVTVIQDNGDGTVKLSSDGEVIDIPFEDLGKYKFTKESTVREWKKSNSPEAFVFEHENDVFSYEFGKATDAREKTVKGRIQYNPLNKTVDFVYKDKQGNIQKYTLSKSELKSVNKGKFKYVRTLETEAEFNTKQSKMSESASKTDFEQLQNQALQRLQFISDFIVKKQEELDILKILVDSVEDELLDTEIEIEKLQEQLSNKTNLTTKKGKNRVDVQKLFDKLNNLQQLHKEIQWNLTILESQKQDLENQIEYTKQYEDVEFESKKSLVDQLIDDQFNLETQLEQVNGVISSLRSLISGIEDVIKKLLDNIDSVFNVAKRIYPNIPFDITKWTDFIRQNPNINKLQPDAARDIAMFNEAINSNIDKITIEDKKVDDLKQSIKANIDVAKNIQDKIRYQEELIAKAIETKEQIVEKKKVERIQNVAQQIYGEFIQKQSATETGNENTDKEVEKEQSAKIDIQELFSTSTSGVTFGDNGLNNPATLRLQTFLNTQSLDDLQLIVITKDNAKQYGLESLIYSDEKTTNKTDEESDNDIIIAFVNKNNKQFVDVNGKIITDKTDLSNKVIYANVKKANLNWSDNQKSYTTKGVPAEKEEEVAKQYQKAHKELRQELINNSKGNTVYLNIQGVSRGRNTSEETIPQAIESVLTLPNNITLNNKQIVFIPTSQNNKVGQVAFQKGNINMPVGRPVLSVGQHFEFLKNKLFTQDDIDTFIKVFQHLYDNVNNKKERENILNFLGKTLYLRDPSKISKTTGEQQESDKGNSQLWLTVDANNNIIINFGKNSSLPLSEIKTYKGVEVLLGFFVGKNQQGVYHNVDRAGLQDAKGNFLVEPFIEYYLDNSNNLKERQWNSYQEYLLSSKYPNNTNRLISEIPLTTTLQPSTTTTPNKYGRYVIFDNPVTNKVTESVKFYTAKDFDEALPYDFSSYEEIPVSEIGKPTIEEVGIEYILSIYQEGNPVKSEETLDYRVKFIKKDGEFWLDKNSVINNSDTKISLKAIQTSITNSVLKNQQVSYVTFGKRNVNKSTPKKEVTEEFTKPTGLKSTLQQKAKTEEFKEQKQNPTNPPRDNFEKPKISLTELRDKLKGLKPDKEYRLATSKEYQPVNLQKAKEWWESRFPQIPFNIVQGLVDGVAWGAIADKMMLLSNVAENGTEYHEAFEAVYKYFLTPKQKAKLNREFRSRKGSFKEYGTGNTIDYSKATDSQIKEQIAEEYREFELSNGKKKWEGEYQKNSLFKKIWNLIHDFLFNSRDSINDIFEKISDAKYKDKIPFATEHTNSNYRVAIKEENPILFREIMNGMTNLLFQNLRGLDISIPEFLLSKNYDIQEQYEGVKKDLENFFGGNPIKEYISQFTSKEQFVNYHYTNNLSLDFLQSLPTALQNNFVTKYEDLTAESFGNLYTALKTYEHIDNNWEEIVKEHKEYLSIYSIEFQEDESIETDEDNKNPTEYVDTLKLSRKNNANTEIKLLIATLIDKQFSKDYIPLEGKKVKKEDLTTKVNSMFLSELVDYSATINSLLFKLAPANTYQDMIDILQKEAIYNPTFLQLIYNLKANIPVEQLSRHDLDLQTKFYKSLNNMKVEFIDLLINSDLTGATVELNEQNAIRLVKSKWQNALKQSGIVVIVNDEYKINKDKLNINSISKEGDVIKFLNSLNIDFNIPFSRLTQEEVETVLKSAQEIYKVLQTNTPEKLFKDDILTRKPLNDLASVYIRYSDFYSEPQHLNIEGEAEQNITLHNFIGMLSKVFNTSKTLDAFIEAIPQYTIENNPYLHFSQILGKGNNFFDSQGNRTKSLIVKIFGGTKNVDEQVGIPTSSQIESNYVAQEFAHNLEGNYYILIPADTKREWGLNFGHFVTKSQANNPSYVLDIMKKYLISEILAARDSKNSNLRNVKNVGVKLRQFDEILKTVNPEFELEIDNELSPEEIISKNNTEINEAITAFIDKNVNKTLTYFRDNGIIQDYKEQENEEVSFAGFTPIKKTNTEPKKIILFAPKSIIKDGLTDSEIEELVKFREINYMFNIIEQYKFIWGDPAQWTDIAKRTKSFLSPRELSVHNNPVFNVWHNIFSNKKTWVNENGQIQSIELQPNDVGFVNYTDEIRVQTFNDVITVSENAEQLFEVLLNKTALDLFNQPLLELTEEQVKQVHSPYLKKGELTNPYEENNEADAQAFMFPNGEREIRQRATTWTEADEELYDYDMALFRSDNKLYSEDENGRKLQEYDNYIISKKNPYINSFIEKTKNAIRQVLKPIYSGLKNTDKFEQDIRKMSIAPLSWRSVKGTSFEKAYIEHVKANTTFINMESANKVGLLTNIEDFYVNGLGNTNVQHEKLNFKYFGIQVETITQKDASTLGTQLTKLGVLNLMINGVPLDFIKANNILSKEEIKNKWKSLSKSEQLDTSNQAKLVNRNSRLLAAMKIKAKQEVFNSFGIKEKEVDGKKVFEFTDYTKFESLIQRELNSREAPENIKKSARLNPTGDGFILPFDLIIGSEKLESILTSVIDKAILRPKMYGGQMPQIASSILASKEKSRELVYKTKNGKWKKVINLNKLTKEEQKSVRITSNDLKFYTKEEPWMEVYLPFYMKEFLEKGKELSISDIPEELRWAIGFRIPTQELNSVEHIKIKGFLPAEYGNSIVVPSEITTKAGSDFDIDKLNIYLYNYIINKKTGKPEKIEFLDNSNSTVEERYNLIHKKQAKKLAYLDDLISKDYEKNILFNETDLTTNKLWTALFGKLNEDLSEYSDEEVTEVLGEFGYSLEDYKKLEEKVHEEKNNRPTLDEFSQLPIELQNNKKAIDNAYVDNLRELLSLEDNFAQLVLPNSAKILQDEATRMNELWENKSSKKNFSSYLSSVDNAITRIAFLVGKKAVGIGAVGQTTHAIAQITGAEFSEDIRNSIKFNFPTNSIIEGNKRVYSFSDKLTKDNQQISSIISAFINAFVDIAKDPYIFYMNGNYTTAGIYITAFKLGMSVKETVLWFNQPVVKEYIKLKTGREKLSNKEIGFKLADKFGFEVTDKGKPVIIPRTEDYNVKELERYIKEWVNQDVTILSQTEEGVTDTTLGLSQQFADNQGNLFAEFLKLEAFSWDLFHYAQAINHDTTRTTSLYSILLKMNDVAKGLNSPLKDSILKALNETFIGTIVQSKNELLQAASPLYLTETNKARDILYPILSEIFQQRGSKLLKEERAKNIRKDFINYILQVFPIEIGGKRMFLTSAIEELMKNNTIGNKLIPIQDKQNKQRLPENFFTKNLFSVKPLNKNGINNIFSLRRFSEKIDVDLAIADFLNLKNHPETDEFMIDLIKVALLQTGVKFSPKSFSQLIPTEEWEKIISQIKKQFDLINLSQTLQGFEASWYQNQWNDRNLVPKAEVSKLNKKGEPMSRFRNWLKIKDFPPLLVYFAESPTDSSINSSNFTKHKYLINLELKKDYSGSPLYSKKQREDMKRNGDYSFLTQVLYKRLEIPNRKGFLDTPLFHDKIYNFPNHSVVFYPVNMYGKPGEVIENYQRQTPSKVNNPIPAFTDQEIYNKLQELGKPVGRFLSEKINKDEDEDITLSLENLLSLEQEANNAMNTNITLLEAKKPVAKPTIEETKETPTQEVVREDIKGENITSKGSEFAKKLTNVGNSVGLTYKGKEYVNSEHAYQTWKSGEFNQAGYNLKGGKVSGGKIGDTFSIMTDILTEKLKQHPELVQGISERGGLEYLQKSTHNVIGDKFWESTGQNKFIEALTQAYKNVEQPINKEIKTENFKNLLNLINNLQTEEVKEYGEVRQKLKNNKELLNFIVKYGNKQEQFLAKLFLDKVESGVDYFSDGVTVIIEKIDGVDFGGYYAHNEVVIKVPSFKTEGYEEQNEQFYVRDFIHKVLHEFAHYASREELNRNPKYKQEVAKLIEKAKQSGLIYDYGLTNEEEFVAETFSNSDFQKRLSEIPYNSTKSIFQKFIDLITSIIGKNIKNTLLEEALNVSIKIVGDYRYNRTQEQPIDKEIKPKIEVVNRYSDSEVRANPDKIYVFGDNTDRRGTGGQASIRNNSNAFGIATKLKPTMNTDAFMSDKDLEANKQIIDSDIQKILDQNKPIVLPKDGFGTGLAKLKEKAPKTYEYLKQQLLDKFGFNNDTGELKPNVVDSSKKITEEDIKNLPDCV